MSTSNGISVQNLNIKKGSAFRLVITYGTSDDLTTYDFECEFRATADGTVLASFSLTNGDFSVDNTLKEIYLDIAASVSVLWTFSESLYDIQFIRTSLTIPDIIELEGKVFVTENITEP